MQVGSVRELASACRRYALREITAWESPLRTHAAVPLEIPTISLALLMRLKHLLNRAVAWGYLKDSPAERTDQLAVVRCGYEGWHGYVSCDEER